MSIAPDKNRAIQNPFHYNDFPGRNDMQTVEYRFTDIALYLEDMPKKKVSSLITIPVAATTTNNELSNFIPANSLITSLGVFFTEVVDVGAAGVLKIGFGVSSGDVSLVAQTALQAAGEDVTINQFISTNNGAAATSSGTAPAIAPGAPSYFANQSSLFFQTDVSGNVLTATSQVKVVMEYITTTNT